MGCSHDEEQGSVEPPFEEGSPFAFCHGCGEEPDHSEEEQKFHQCALSIGARSFDASASKAGKSRFSAHAEFHDFSCFELTELRLSGSAAKDANAGAAQRHTSAVLGVEVQG
jgi:hypothetical protein